MVRRLYETDARGIRDEELIDAVGYGLYARCASILAVTAAQHGRVACPRCSTIIMRETGGDDDAVLRCEACEWEIAWAAYHRTYRGKQLYGGNAVDIFRRFHERFPALDEPRAKMLAIDRLLHEFHAGLKEPGRPVAANLLEGTLGEVIAFLETLSYGSESTNGLAEAQSGWRATLHATSWVRHFTGVSERRDTQPT
jgi:hypothetical protein